MNIPKRVWRSLVRHQCCQFKTDYFKAHCEDPNKCWIFSREDGRYIHRREATVDHIVPLRELISQFLAQPNLPTTLNQYKKAFKQFHKQHASLRVISHSLNQELSRV